MRNYIFYVHPNLDDKKVADIMTNKRISSLDCTYRFIYPITEAIKFLAHDPKGVERFWGIGFDIQKFKQVLDWTPMSCDICNHGTYKEFICEGREFLDLSVFNSPESHCNEMIVLAPTNNALNDNVFLYKENGHNKWRWKGISCQWIYSPKASQLLQSEPLVEIDESKEHFRSHVVAVPKKEEDIYKYIISEDSNRFKECNRAKIVDDNESSKLF